MNRYNTFFSVAGLLVLLLLIVLSRHSKESFVSIQNTLQVASVYKSSEVTPKPESISRRSRVIDDTLVAFGEDIQDAVAIDTTVALYVFDALSTTILSANSSLTPHFGDASFVRSEVFPTVVSIPQVQVLATGVRELSVDFKEGFAEDTAAGVALFTYLASASVAEAPTQEEKADLVSVAQTFIDTVITSSQRATEYGLNLIMYLLPDYANQAGILVQTGSAQAQMLWENRFKLLHIKGNANAGSALLSGPVALFFDDSDSSNVGKWVGKVSLTLEEKILDASFFDWHSLVAKPDWLSN